MLIDVPEPASLSEINLDTGLASDENDFGFPDDGFRLSDDNSDDPLILS